LPYIIYMNTHTGTKTNTEKENNMNNEIRTSNGTRIDRCASCGSYINNYTETMNLGSHPGGSICLPCTHTPKKFEMIKSNLSEYNNGVCGSRNNSRYTGASVVWEVKNIEEDCAYTALKRKGDAEMVTAFANSQQFPTGAQDLMGEFYSYIQKINPQFDIDKIKEC